MHCSAIQYEIIKYYVGLQYYTISSLIYIKLDFNVHHKLTNCLSKENPFKESKINKYIKQPFPTYVHS